MEEKIKSFFKTKNIKVYGWADLDSKDKSKIMLSEDILKVVNSAIVFGIPLSKLVIENLNDAPDLLYLHHYRQANYILDRTACEFANFLEENGFSSIAIPASQIIDWKQQKAHLSHKYFARLCGIGWLGRNNLIVNNVYKSRLRLVTVLTAYQFNNGPEILKFNCGSCTSCIELCPAKAISTDAERFDHIRCFETIKQLTKKNNISQYICGLCIKACEHGNNKDTRAS